MSKKTMLRLQRRICLKILFCALKDKSVFRNTMLGFVILAVTFDFGDMISRNHQYKSFWYLAVN